MEMSSRKLLLGLSALVTVVAVAVAVYFYIQYWQTQQILKNPTLAAQQQTNQLVDQVGKLMELPKGEQPTVATVSDVTKLKDQAFFRNAKNGDKVLIYTNSKKAILFRQSENKIIDVAPVNLGESQITPTPTGATKKVPTPTKKPTLTPEQ